MSSWDPHVSTCTHVWGHVCAVGTRRQNRTGHTCSTGQCMSYVRSRVQLEFVNVLAYVCVLTYLCSNTHICSSSLQEQRQTIRKAGNQGLFALLPWGDIRFTKICQDYLGIGAGRLAKRGQNTSGTHGWWLLCSRQSALF